MTPVVVIETLLKVNKPVAGFILAGLGVIAAAAIAVTWLGGNQNALSLAFYILGFAVLVTILMFVVGNQRMRAVLGWILVTIFALFMVGLVDAAAQISGRMPIPACYLKMLAEHPDTCMAKLSPQIAVTGNQNTPVTAETTSVATTSPYEGPVFLHYGPDIAPGDALKLATELNASGWQLNDPDAGGILVKNAPSSNQIRFYHASSKRAAIQLAAQVSTALGRPKIAVRDFSGSGLMAANGLLEIWLSR